MLKSERRLKTKKRKSKLYPVSGRSVFSLLRIIQDKSKKLSRSFNKGLKKIGPNEMFDYLTKR